MGQDGINHKCAPSTRKKITFLGQSEGWRNQQVGEEKGSEEQVGNGVNGIGAWWEERKAPAPSGRGKGGERSRKEE